MLNALGAVVVARELGSTTRRSRAALAAAERVPGRFEPVDEGQPFAVFVDYSHKPDALEAVLRTARGLTRGRLIVVFGAGGDRDRGKRPLMGARGGRARGRRDHHLRQPAQRRRPGDHGRRCPRRAGDGPLERIAHRKAAIERAIARRRRAT